MRLFAVHTTPADADVVADRCWIAGAAGIWERAPVDGLVELRVGVEPADADAFCAALSDLAVDDITERDAIELATRSTVIRTATASLELRVPPTVFGDGRHPTTNACVEILDRIVTPNDRVLDVGCGTGALSLVAAARGAAVVAIDIDPAAVDATAENARRNGLALDARAETLDMIGDRFDVVVANVSAGTLIELADELTGRVDRDLVLSGILLERWDEVRTRFALPVVEEREQEGWVTALLSCEL